MIEQGDILTLDDNKEYTVVATTEYEGKNYCYLIDMEEETNTSFCEILENEELEELEDQELIETLKEKFEQQL